VPRREQPFVEDRYRSRCPINLSLEVFGDRWTLLILRDVAFGGKSHFREFLESDEGISTNILADRLSLLVREGILATEADPGHKQRTLYRLTEKGIALVPVLVQIGVWGVHHMPASKELGGHARELERRGPKALVRLLAELRSAHLGGKQRESR